MRGCGVSGWVHYKPLVVGSSLSAAVYVGFLYHAYVVVIFFEADEEIVLAVDER